ncbi:MAG: putative Ig domain-containing protein [Bacteroidota bacterium]
MKMLKIFKITVLLVLVSSPLQILAQEPPFLGPIDDYYLTFGDAFYLNVDAKYADPKESYELVEARPGMQIDPVTGVIDWVPDEEGDGGRVTVRAYNSAGESVRSFWIYLTDGNYCSENIISYWTLDETSGNSFEDNIGAYTATSVSSMSDIEGVAGRGKLCSPAGKTEQYLTVNDLGQYDFPRNGVFTMSFWFRYDGVGASGTNNQVLVARGDPTPSLENMWMLLMVDERYTPAKLTFELKPKMFGPPFSQTISDIDIDEGEWTHVALVYQGATYPTESTVSVYLNGAKKEYSVPFPDAAFEGDGNFPLEMAFWSAYPTNTFPLNGAIDEIITYNEALTAQELNKVYQDGLSGKPVCKKGNWFPFVTSVPVTTAAEDASYTYTVTADDLDGDILSMSSVLIPSWTYFDRNSGILSGTPRSEDVGTHQVHLIVSDGKIEVNHRFEITVTDTNDPPVFTSAPITSCNLDAAYIYFVQASDPEGDELTFTQGPGMPDWLTFESSTMILFGIPREGDEGDHIIQLIVSDGEFDITQVFTIRVIDLNTAPQITSDPDKTSFVGQPYSYVVQASDNEDDPMTFSAELKPSWLEFNPAIRMLSGTPTYDDAGKHNVVIAVSDGKRTTQQDFIVEVRYPLGFEEVSGLVTKVFPNPAREYVVIETFADLSMVEITDLSGKVLIHKNVDRGKQVLQVDVSVLDAGVYMLRVFGEDQLHTEKLIIH